MEKAKEQKRPPKKLRIIIFFLIILIPAVWFLFLNKNSDFDKASDKLTGNWLREDGTYSISISNVIKTGQMTAAYFNPNPIHVETADWGVKDGKLIIQINLNDVNYRGSNYKLTYNEETDRLVGKYFTAITKQTYEVAFNRK